MTPKEATDKKIITKQVVINTPTSARLLPITADEKVIDEIQNALTELKELKAIAAQYFSLALKRDSKWSTGLSKEEEKELLDIEYKIIEMISENQL